MNMPDRSFLAACLRRTAGLLGLLAVLSLAACGGGSGAPSGNPFAPPPVTPPPPAALVVLPADSVAYTGVPAVLTITGGTAPYRAFSSNGTVLPVAQTVNGNSVVLLAGDVAADTPVTITVQDAAAQTATATVTVRPATLLNTFTVIPNLQECGANAICSGQTGTASVVVQGPGGARVAGRQVRFEVVSGPYSILTTNPAQPAAPSATVVSDASGLAQVTIRANVDAPTQPAQIRATDLVSGQQRTVQFTIVQNTNGQTILSVIPSTSTITAVFKNECSSGVPVDYYIFGGTPPYRITASFPNAVTLLNTPVNVSGGFFEAVTNGQCVDPMTFTIQDATGRVTTATMQNLPGTQDRPTAPPIPPIVVSPSAVTAPTCAGRTFNFVVTGGGGTRFARVSPQRIASGVVNPQASGVDSGGNFTVTFGPATLDPNSANFIAPGSVFSVTVGDAAGSTAANAQITCTNG